MLVGGALGRSFFGSPAPKWWHRNFLFILDLFPTSSQNSNEPIYIHLYFATWLAASFLYCTLTFLHILSVNLQSLGSFHPLNIISLPRRWAYSLLHSYWPLSSSLNQSEAASGRWGRTDESSHSVIKYCATIPPFLLK